jgi:hypothetical protein
VPTTIAGTARQNTLTAAIADLMSRT